MPADLLRWPNASNGEYAPDTRSINSLVPTPRCTAADETEKIRGLKLEPVDDERLPNNSAHPPTQSSQTVDQVDQLEITAEGPRTHRTRDFPYTTKGEKRNMNIGRAVGITMLIIVLTLMTACAGTDAPDLSATDERVVRATPDTNNPESDFYRAEGLMELYGSTCRSKDRAVIGIQYTHSIVTGKAWRGSGDAMEEFVRRRGKYGENLHVDSNGDDMRLYAYDYYARGRPGELIIIGRPGSSSEDRCMIGVLTDERLRQASPGDMEKSGKLANDGLRGHESGCQPQTTSPLSRSNSISCSPSKSSARQPSASSSPCRPPALSLPTATPRPPTT